MLEANLAQTYLPVSCPLTASTKDTMHVLARGQHTALGSSHSQDCSPSCSHDLEAFPTPRVTLCHPVVPILPASLFSMQTCPLNLPQVSTRGVPGCPAASSKPRHLSNCLSGKRVLQAAWATRTCERERALHFPSLLFTASLPFQRRN